MSENITFSSHLSILCYFHNKYSFFKSMLECTSFPKAADAIRLSTGEAKPESNERWHQKGVWWPSRGQNTAQLTPHAEDTSGLDEAVPAPLRDLRSHESMRTCAAEDQRHITDLQYSYTGGNVNTWLDTHLSAVTYWEMQEINSQYVLLN